MTTLELRNSIFALAIEGKLVKQRVDEPDSSFLIDDLKKTKKIKTANSKNKEKLTISDNLIYDSVQPFNIPKKWKWINVNDIFSIISGLSFKKENLNRKSSKMIRVLRGGNIFDCFYKFKEDDTFISNEFVNSSLFLKKNTIITPAVTSLEHVGKMARIDSDLNDAVVGGFVLMLEPYYNNDIFSKYLLYSMSSRYFREECKKIVNKSGQAFYNLSRNKFSKILLPIPSLQEQSRIVKKIEELLPLIEEYEVYEKQLNEYNGNIKEKLKESILKEAFEGKLVPQNLSDCSVHSLLKEIEKNKKTLEIDVNVGPFNIPDNWKWVNLGSISNINGGYAFKSSNYRSDGIRVVRISDFNEIGFVNTRIVRHEYSDDLEPYVVSLNDILLCMTGGTVGKSLYVKEMSEKMVANQRVATIKILNPNKEYINYVILSPFIQKIINDSKNSTNDNISMDTIKNFPIPLPPLEEQNRIVAKIDELFKLIDRLPL